MVINYGEGRGASKREVGVGATEVLPLHKGGGGSLSHAEGAGGGINNF